MPALLAWLLRAGPCQARTGKRAAPPLLTPPDNFFLPSFCQRDRGGKAHTDGRRLVTRPIFRCPHPPPTANALNRGLFTVWSTTNVILLRHIVAAVSGVMAFILVKIFDRLRRKDAVSKATAIIAKAKEEARKPTPRRG